jgi:hypothetical protein
MADLSITQTPLAGGKIRYTLGQPNWQDRRIPDIRRPGSTVQIEQERLIDVIILGDGFTSSSDFRKALKEWLDNFYAIKVYDLFAGCLRIRALYTPSAEPASMDRRSYYRCLLSDDGHSIVKDDWWKANDSDGVAFREAFWESVDTFADANTRRYPLDLDVGSSDPEKQAITNDHLQDVYRNLVVSLLVRSVVENDQGNEEVFCPSGFSRDVYRPAPDQSRHVRVGFGCHEIHEFSHAFGFLSDEYINGRACQDIEQRLSDLKSEKQNVERGLEGPPPLTGKARGIALENLANIEAQIAMQDANLASCLDESIKGLGSTSTRVDPATSSVFSLSNLRYSNSVDDVPWVHLSPCGWQGRTASGPEPSPLVGWLWVGGGVHLGVWHSEYKCLMNGRHDNFWFTQVAAEDPTANPDGTYTEEEGADLRDRERFCLWCQEIVTLRILEKTDQLLEEGDPADVTSQGITWYARWCKRLRSNYYQLFDVAQQIADAEARYASLTPGRNGEPLWQSDLYSVPKAAPAGPASPVPPASDDEVFLLTGFAAIP